MPQVVLFEAEVGQCRRPLWRDKEQTRLDKMYVCCAPVVPGRTYCAECRPLLIAGPPPPSGRGVKRAAPW